MTQFSSLWGGRLDRELGTDRTNLFTPLKRQAAVNEGQQEFADLTECLLRQSTITILAGVGEYDLNASTIVTGAEFVRFAKEGVKYQHVDAAGTPTILAGDDLQRKDIPWLDRYRPGWQLSTASSGTQFPSNYYVRLDGGSYWLGFTPQPGLGSSETASAIVPYVMRAIPMTSDTAEPFTVAGLVRGDLRVYHQGLVHYGAAQLEKLRKDKQASAEQMQNFLNYVTRYLGGSRQKGGRQITATRHYFQTRRVSGQGRDPRR